MNDTVLLVMHDNDKPEARKVPACPKMWRTSEGETCLCNLDTGHPGDCMSRDGETSSNAKELA